MLMQVVFRFIAGVCGDRRCLKPNSFAGLFGAAPSVALATLSLTVLTEGKGTAALEARSMIVGGIAFVYAAACARVMRSPYPRRGPSRVVRMKSAPYTREAPYQIDPLLSAKWL
jgi:hypothetical protein